MRAFKALFHKELREHGGAVFLLVVCLALVLGLTLLGIANREDRTSNLSFVPGYLLTYVLVSASLLANRLVVREYQAHTQQFLETLPLQRWQVVTLKYLLGLGILTGIVCLVIGTGCLAAVTSEPVGWKFACLLFLRAMGYLYCLWGACFLVAFTGRFRPPLVAGFWLLLIAAVGGSDLHLWDLPPLTLIEPSIMPYERNTLPLSPLLQSLLLGTLLGFAGMGLAIWREGSWVVRLSGRLSPGEKAALGAGFLLLIVLASIVDVKRTKEPFQFEHDAVLSRPDTSLQILYLHEAARPSAQKLLTWLDPRLKSLKADLKMGSLPPIHIALNESSDGQTIEVAKMGKNDGILLRCNFTDSKFNPADLGTQVVHSLLSYRTRGRAMLDPNHWFLDGFSVWFMQPDDGERLEEAIWVTRGNFPTQAEIEGWEALADHTGTRLSESFAASGLAAMEQAYGRAAILDLARNLYIRPVHPDIREQLYQWTHPLSRLFNNSTGESYSSFFVDWRRWLEEKGSTQAIFRKYGEPSARIKIQENGFDYSLSFANPPPSGLTWALLHTNAGPFDKAIPDRLFKREEHLWPSSASKQSHSLVDLYSPGDRVVVGIEVQFPQRNYPLRILTERRQIP